MSVRSSKQSKGEKQGKQPAKLPTTETGLINRIEKYHCPFSALALGELFLKKGDFKNAKEAFSVASMQGYLAGLTFVVSSARAVLDRMKQIECDASKLKNQLLDESCEELVLQFIKASEEKYEL